MKIINLLQVFILASIIIQSFQKITIITNQLRTTAFYQCIKSKGYSWIGTVLESTSTGFSKDSLQNLYNANNAGLEVDIVYTPCRALQPEQQAQQIINNLPSNSFKTLWALPTSNFEDQSCTWDMFSPMQNCQYLKNFKKQMIRLQKKVGFSSHQMFWQLLFGSRKACAQLSQNPISPLLWVPSQSPSPDFNDFRPFGGWKRPFMKTMDTQTICGQEVFTSYYEY